MRRLIYSIIKLLDLALVPLNAVLLIWLRLARKMKFRYQAMTRRLALMIGVFPIIDHYYEPMFDMKYLRKSLREDRNLVGIDLDSPEGLSLIRSFNYQSELLSFPRKKTSDKFQFSYDYGSYPSGDSEIYYSFIRKMKPKRIIEIGSGTSTLMALNAIKMNKSEDKSYDCDLTCIEPYEYDWLEQLDLKVIRERVEKTPLSLFQSLCDHDILFIDSSHIIRPQGDVLFEILEVLPSLRSGVYVHFHDVCTPKDYFDEWVLNQVFWNEQYLLEAFLSFNNQFRVVLASNYLFHHHKDLLLEKCPVLKEDLVKKPEREVGSFWIRRI